MFSFKALSHSATSQTKWRRQAHDVLDGCSWRSKRRKAHRCAQAKPSDRRRPWRESGANKEVMLLLALLHQKVTTMPGKIR
jgi:hypothetical protein